MAITIASAVCTSWKKEILMGTHLFKASGGNTFKMLLLKATAAAAGTYGAATQAVGTPGSGSPTASNVGTDEAVDTSGGTHYTAGGFTMTPNADPVIDTTIAYIDWTTDPQWTTASLSSRGAILYNDTVAGKPACAVYDFGSDQTSTAGTFTITLPAPAGATGLLRIA
jgi:hypothetical protein